jgi:hypothetical protein
LTILEGSASCSASEGGRGSGKKLRGDSHLLGGAGEAPSALESAAAGAWEPDSQTSASFVGLREGWWTGRASVDQQGARRRDECDDQARADPSRPHLVQNRPSRAPQQLTAVEVRRLSTSKALNAEQEPFRLGGWACTPLCYSFPSAEELSALPASRSCDPRARRSMLYVPSNQVGELHFDRSAVA